MNDASPGFVINRDFLLNGGLEALVQRNGNFPSLWSDAQRAESLAAILAERPPGEDGVWLFCYGSLIWNPMIEVAARRSVTIAGWHRAFCLQTQGGRGTRENPGLMLGLDAGGECAGVAIWVPQARIAEDLALIWKREMLTGSYIPRWLPATDASGAAMAVIAFLMNTQSRQYVRLDEETTAQRLATARGELGSCADYLLHTHAALLAENISDPFLDRLTARVRTLLHAPSVP